MVLSILTSLLLLAPPPHPQNLDRRFSHTFQYRWIFLWIIFWFMNDDCWWKNKENQRIKIKWTKFCTDWISGTKYYKMISEPAALRNSIPILEVLKTLFQPNKQHKVCILFYSSLVCFPAFRNCFWLRPTYRLFCPKFAECHIPTFWDQSSLFA